MQPGKYEPRNREEDEDTFSQADTTGGKTTKSARKTATANSSKLGTSSPRAKSRPDPPATTNNRKQPAGIITDPARASQLSEKTTATEGRGSMMAHSVDGRPASAMTSAYEASGSVDFSGRGTDDLPFTIEPQQGCIAAGEEGSFTVRFSPLEIDTFDAILLCQ